MVRVKLPDILNDPLVGQAAVIRMHFCVTRSEGAAVCGVQFTGIDQERCAIGPASHVRHAAISIGTKIHGSIQIA